MSDFIDNDQPCTEIVMVPWPNKFTEWADSAENFTIARGYQLYVHEWMLRKGQDVKRFTIIARKMVEFFGWDKHPSEIKLAASAAYESFRLGDGKSPLTVRKEFAMHLAAMNHNFKRERIASVPFIELPDGEPRKRRPLTEGEFRRLMQSPLPKRIRLLFLMAYHTGHRARAIEGLTWDRVHFDTRTIDFNDPGMRRTKKRRVDGFPIPDELLPRLESAFARRDPADPFVIGRGSPRVNAQATTYHGCKAALKAIGIDELGICRHTLRKTFVTERIKARMDPEKIAKLIADNPATMRKHYSILNAEDLRSTVNIERAA